MVNVIQIHRMLLLISDVITEGVVLCDIQIHRMLLLIWIEDSKAKAEVKLFKYIVCCY